MSVKNQIIDEINELLSDPSSSLVPILQKAARLANLCGNKNLLLLFEYHLGGYDSNVRIATDNKFLKSPSKEAKMSQETYEMFEADRISAEGKIQSHSVANMERYLEDLNRARTPENITEMVDTIESLHSTLSRIKIRVGKCVRKIEMDCVTSRVVENPTQSKTIFIGHGHSLVWKNLKDFIQERLRLKWDEFNRESTAGVATKERLEELLENASFAFLIMTAEDEHIDKSLHARENVTHEIGLFQGKLGFRKAIVLLEEGCQEFSNIVGIGQIRFPKGDIEAKFEEIRKVLEREGIAEFRTS